MIRRVLFTAISLSIAALGVRDASAQVTTIERTITTPVTTEQTVTIPTTFSCPAPVRTVSSTTTTTTTTDEPAPRPLEESRRVMIMRSGPVGSVSTNTLYVDKNYGREDFVKRLSAMQDQINLGLTHGFINSYQADRLSARQADLAAFEGRVCADGFPKYESDELERRMNSLNEAITDSLSNGTSTAGIGNMQ